LRNQRLSNSILFEEKEACVILWPEAICKNLLCGFNWFMFNKAPPKQNTSWTIQASVCVIFIWGVESFCFANLITDGK